MVPDGGSTSFSDLFKLGREVLRTETFVLHEAQTRTSSGKRALVKCLFIFGLTKQERGQVGDDVRRFKKVKHSCILALQDVISEPEVRWKQDSGVWVCHRLISQTFLVFNFQFS